MAVYAFFLNGQALKVGKVGPSSNARYTPQRYNPKSAGSNLARSIPANPAKVSVLGIEASGIGEWIRGHTDRVNLLAPASFGDPMLSLLESFLNVRWEARVRGQGERHLGLHERDGLLAFRLLLVCRADLDKFRLSPQPWLSRVRPVWRHSNSGRCIMWNL
jgi:hypothetical protein